VATIIILENKPTKFSAV